MFRLCTAWGWLSTVWLAIQSVHMIMCMVWLVWPLSYLCSIPPGSLIPPPPNVNGGILARNDCTLLEYNCPRNAFGAMSGTLQYDCDSQLWGTNLIACTGMLHIWKLCLCVCLSVCYHYSSNIIHFLNKSTVMIFLTCEFLLYSEVMPSFAYCGSLYYNNSFHWQRILKLFKWLIYINEGLIVHSTICHFSDAARSAIAVIVVVIFVILVVILIIIIITIFCIKLKSKG